MGPGVGCSEEGGGRGSGGGGGGGGGARRGQGKGGSRGHTGDKDVSKVPAFYLVRRLEGELNEEPGEVGRWAHPALSRDNRRCLLHNTAQLCSSKGGRGAFGTL